LVGNRHRALPGERRLAAQELVQDDAQRVHVGAGVRRYALGLLGAEVGGGADDRPGACQLLGVVEGTGDAKVHHLHAAVGGQQDVARLDVAVEHAGMVGDGECGGRLGGDLGSSACQQRAFGAADVAQGPPLDELHHHVVGLAVLAPVEDRHDVGVAEVGGGLGLAAEPGDEGVVLGELRVEDLDRHLPPEEGVFGGEHVGHAAAGDVAGDPVAVGQQSRVGHGA
jgi:hypothetical protein